MHWKGIVTVGIIAVVFVAIAMRIAPVKKLVFGTAAPAA